MPDRTPTATWQSRPLAQGSVPTAARLELARRKAERERGLTALAKSTGLSVAEILQAAAEAGPPPALSPEERQVLDERLHKVGHPDYLDPLSHLAVLLGVEREQVLTSIRIAQGEPPPPGYENSLALVVGRLVNSEGLTPPKGPTTD